MSEAGPPATSFGPRIDARDAFERTRAALGRLLAELSPVEWTRSTICAPWRVRDVVAHVLGGDLARLSRSRDGLPAERPTPGQSLPRFLHRYNQQWVDAAARISPTLLRDLMDTVTPQVLAYWRAVDLDAFGEPVSWADPGPAPVWLDCAREFTESWTHLQQILQATGRPAIADDDALHTAIDTFLRALPHTLTHAQRSGPLAISVPGPAGGRWTVGPAPSGWAWIDQPPAGTTTLTLEADTLWRLCTRATTPQQAREHAQIDGNIHLATAALDIVSIIR